MQVSFPVPVLFPCVPSTPGWPARITSWAEYRQEGAASPLRTGISRWRLCWRPAEPSAEKIDLAVEAVESR